MGYKYIHLHPTSSILETNNVKKQAVVETKGYNPLNSVLPKKKGVLFPTPGPHPLPLSSYHQTYCGTGTGGVIDVSLAGAGFGYVTSPHRAAHPMITFGVGRSKA